MLLISGFDNSTINRQQLTYVISVLVYYCLRCRKSIRTSVLNAYENLTLWQQNEVKRNATKENDEEHFWKKLALN